MQILLLAALATLIPGQLIRLDFAPNAAITLSDLVVFSVSVFFVATYLFERKKIQIAKNFIFIILFALSATASLLYAANFLTLKEVLISSLFLIRFLLYAMLSVAVAAEIKKGEIEKWVKGLLIIGFTFAAIGLIQFFVLPDLTKLQLSGWDPHLNRLFSTTYDPNYTGGILTIFCSFAISLYLFTKKPHYLFLGALFALATVLTFSRSSYLALSASFVVIGILKSQKMIAFLLAIFFLSFILSSNFRSRISGAIALDETSRARIESWQNAIMIFKKSPILGVGFNTYRYTQAKYGFFSIDNPLGGHSGSGADSSLLTVLATTGIVGTSLFLMYFASVIKKSYFNRFNYLNLAILASLSSAFFHSQFVNSLFFPQYMLILFFIIGLGQIYDN